MIVVSTSSAAPMLRKYKFHLMDATAVTIFRYDNSPRHPRVASHPHHKHVGPGETVVESGPPDIEAIIAEVRQHIERSKR